MKIKTHAFRPVLGICEFLDGPSRYVYGDAQWGQFIIDDDGERVYGLWVRPDEAPDTPAVVDLGRGRIPMKAVPLRSCFSAE